MKDKVKVVFGIEFECEYDAQRVDIEKGSYHEGVAITPNWVAERDGSLSNTKAGWDTVELVSQPFFKEDFDEKFDELIKIFGGKPFGEVVNVNNSCGAHVHVSVWKDARNKNSTLLCKGWEELGGGVEDSEDVNILVMESVEPVNFFLPISTMKLIREQVMKLLPEEAKKRYFRTYSKVPLHTDYYERKSEWNRSNGNHYEYRSFNLSGCKSWDEVRNLYKKVFGIISENILVKMPEVLSSKNGVNVVNQDRSSVSSFVGEKVNLNENISVRVKKKRGRAICGGVQNLKSIKELAYCSNSNIFKDFVRIVRLGENEQEVIKRVDDWVNSFGNRYRSCMVGSALGSIEFGKVKKILGKYEKVGREFYV